MHWQRLSPYFDSVDSHGMAITARCPDNKCSKQFSPPLARLWKTLYSRESILGAPYADLSSYCPASICRRPDLKVVDHTPMAMFLT